MMRSIALSGLNTTNNFCAKIKKNIMDKKESEADKRFRKKVSQMVMLLEREKVAGKIDWHSREHLSGDAHCVATAINSYVKSK